MAISKKAKFGIAVVGSALLTVVITYRGTKRTIRKQCKRQVRSELGKVPLLTEEFIDEQAEKVCDV